MKQLIFIHGGNAYLSRSKYLEALRNETYDPKREKERDLRWHRHLESDLGPGWEVFKPQMPGGRNNHYEEWEIWFSKILKHARDGVVLVGHSLGGNFLVKYLSENKHPVTISSLHLIAPAWNTRTFTMPTSYRRLKAIPHIYVYHSTDDTVVPFSDAERLCKVVPTATLIRFENRGHFLGSDFPELLAHLNGELDVA
jgi:predicted alpha/beta hydrolase family esterase